MTINASLSRLLPTKNKDGDKVAQRAPSTPAPARLEATVQQSGTFRNPGAMPFVKAGSAVDFEGLPLGRAEIRSASSSLIVLGEASGLLPIDWNVANSWLVILAGEATFYSIVPQAIPGAQGPDRNREVPISITVIPNGHKFQFNNVGRPGGEDIDWTEHDATKRQTFAIGGLFGPDVPSGGFWDLYYTGFDRS